jgi:hypothetical protein
MTVQRHRWLIGLAGVVSVLSAVGLAGPASASESVSTMPAATTCVAGFSCYYDGSSSGFSGNGLLWNAPHCGFFNFGSFSPPLNDRVSSIINRGGGAVQAYNWVGKWQAVGTAVPPGGTRNYTGSQANIIDAVSIAC